MWRTHGITFTSSLFQVSAGCIDRPCTESEEKALGAGECPLRLLCRVLVQFRILSIRVSIRGGRWGEGWNGETRKGI